MVSKLSLANKKKRLCYGYKIIMLGKLCTVVDSVVVCILAAEDDSPRVCAHA